MATFTSPRNSDTPGVTGGLIVVRRASHRELLEALGLLLGLFGVLLVLALTMGGALPVGQ